MNSAVATGGPEHAFSNLVNAVYADLRRYADRDMRQRFNRHALDGLTRQPTEIVHEAVIRMAQQHAEFRSRSQFFGIATQMITREIIDYQRRRLSAKRGKGVRHSQSLDGATQVAATAPLDAQATAELEFVDVLNQLEKEHARAAEVAVLRLICEHTMPQIAKLLDISQATVERDWRFASAYLRKAYSAEPNKAEPSP